MGENGSVRLGRRDFLRLAAGGVAGAWAAACAPAQQPGATTGPTQAPQAVKAPPGKNDLIVAQGGDLSKLDPHMSTSVNDITISFNVFDNLVLRDRDNKLQPMLATEWKLLNDTTWQFKLRQGVKFHNGDPFTARDVKFSIERTYDPNEKTLVATVFTTIGRIEIVDDYTVNFIMKAPDPLLPARLAFYGGQIIPEKYYKQVGPDQFNLRPVGAGPLRFVEWVKDDRAVFEAFPDYWGGKIDVDRVIFRPLPEPAARVGALLNGSVDIITKLPPDLVDQVQKSGRNRVESVLYAGLYVLAVNSKVKPLDNPLVKQALSLAVDRKAIIDELWKGQGIIPNGPIAKGDFAYPEDLPPLEYNPAKAKDRLRQAGYNNEEIYIETTQGYLANDRQMSEAIAQMWKDVGVNVKVELIEYSVRAQKNRDKTFKGLWWSDPTSTLGDPDGMMWRLLGPGGPQDYWRHPRFDELGNRARFELDQEKRRQYYREMVTIFLEHLPWIPVIQPYESYGVANYVEWKPYQNQYFDVRRYNLKLNR